MKDKAKELIEKYQQGECGKEETALLHRWYLTELVSKAELEGPTDPLAEEQLLWNRITQHTGITCAIKEEPLKIRRIIPIKWLIAASIFLIACIGLYTLNRSSSLHEARMAELRKNDVKPGRDNAKLTFSDGSVVNLDTLVRGDVLNQQGLQITKTQDGQLAYTITPSLKLESYPTISTPRGGKYQIVLVDGTKVWLNASSSLKFPTAFSSAQRNVEVSGEAYFEVAKDATRPFYIHAKNQTIEVLGTHFNVSAYPDDAIVSTTLLEGSVNVSTNKQSVIIKPGEQAILQKDQLKVSEANIEEAIAWKKDKFKFDNENIVSLMRKISRWYDVEVEFNGPISNERFGGQVSRSRNISEVLEVLQLTGLVHFEISKGDANGKGRRVIVLPN